MPRLFTGIEIPQDIRLRLATLKAPLPGAKWVEPESLHITLRFAGDIDNVAAGELYDALAQISVPAFKVTIAGLGAFGGNDPRVLWAGVTGGPELETLQRAHERAARMAGLAPEGRGYKPHVTLARLKNSRADAVARYLGRAGDVRFEPFLVERFVLFSSRPRVGGGPYVVEEAFPLLRGHDLEDWQVPGDAGPG
jgi:2'-5' RNA ligase